MRPDKTISPNADRWYATAPWRRYAARFVAFRSGFSIEPDNLVADGEMWTMDHAKLRDWSRRVSERR